MNFVGGRMDWLASALPIAEDINVPKSFIKSKSANKCLCANAFRLQRYLRNGSHKIDMLDNFKVVSAVNSPLPAIV